MKTTEVTKVENITKKLREDVETYNNFARNNSWSTLQFSGSLCRYRDTVVSDFKSGGITPISFGEALTYLNGATIDVTVYEDYLKEVAAEWLTPTRKRILNDTMYHAPTGGKKEKHEALRAKVREIELYLTEILIEGRDLSTALTKCDELMFWANAGIARNPELDTPGQVKLPGV